MIILDMESSGLDTGKCGIWQIGAIELENPENQFLEEARIDDEDHVEEGALKVTGKTEEELRDKNKQSQKELILKFLDWAKTCKTKLIVGHNVGWDFFFMRNKCCKYNVVTEFMGVVGHNVIDTYSVAQIKYLEINGNFAFKENGLGKMGLKRVLKLCGLKDNRMHLNDKEEVDNEGTPHNALEDAKLTAECFSRLIYGKNLFPEYAEYEIPGELKK